MNIGIITPPRGKAATIPLSNLINILKSGSYKIYVITSGEVQIITSNNNNLNIFKINYNTNKNIIHSLLNNIYLQLQISSKIFLLNKKVNKWILFLDADEVPDGARFSEWLDSSDYKAHTALKLSNYWYFREPCNQAVETEDSIVLAQKRALENEMILHADERDAIYNLAPGPKRRNVMDHDGRPMFHHYSWVRTQEEMLKKVSAWGHKEDRNWIELVNREFQGPFSGKDFIHEDHYRIVKPFFEFNLQEPTFSSIAPSQPTRLGSKEVLHLLKKKYFWNFF